MHFLKEYCSVIPSIIMIHFIRKFSSLFKKDMKGETQMIQKLTDMPHGTIHPSSRGQNIGKRNVHTQENLCNYRLPFKSKVIFLFTTMHMTLKRIFTYNLVLKHIYSAYCFLVYCGKYKNRKP